MLTRTRFDLLMLILLVMVTLLATLPRAMAATPPARSAGLRREFFQTTTTVAQHAVTLAWVASADASSTNPVTYNVLRAPGTCGASGQTFTSLAAGVTVTTYKDTTVVGGQDYCYQVDAEGSNGAVSVNNPTVPAAVPPFPVTGLTESSQ